MTDETPTLPEAPAAAPAVQEPPPEWQFLLNPDAPERSVVVYRGAPLNGVISASVAVESIPDARGLPVVRPVLSLRIVPQTIGLGTLVPSKG